MPKLFGVLIVAALCGCSKQQIHDAWYGAPLTPEEKYARDIEKHCQAVASLEKDRVESLKEAANAQQSIPAGGFYWGAAVSRSGNQAYETALHECQAKYGYGPLTPPGQSD